MLGRDLTSGDAADERVGGQPAHAIEGVRAVGRLLDRRPHDDDAMVDEHHAVGGPDAICEPLTRIGIEHLPFVLVDEDHRAVEHARGLMADLREAPHRREQGRVIRVVVHHDAGVRAAAMDAGVEEDRGADVPVALDDLAVGVDAHQISGADLVPPLSPWRGPQVSGRFGDRDMTRHVLVEADPGEDAVQAGELLTLVHLDAGRHRPGLPLRVGHRHESTVPLVTTLAARVRALAATDADGTAFVTATERMTWLEYDEHSEALAASLTDRGFGDGDRIAVQLDDGPGVHTAFLAIEKAGCVIVGVGPRAGRRERDHLVTKTGTRLVIDDLGEVPNGGFRGNQAVARNATPRSERDLWLLNSTSGTTGLPKVVMHDQTRWFAFHELAVEAGRLGASDVFMSALPAPFGFGIWTAHVTPTLLGAPCAVVPRFDADACLELIERERVTVLAAVSTQFMMLLDAPSARTRDLSSLRVMFTGGEMVPYRRAAEFEDRTGCAVLQFYGSNETGALSRTTLDDDREHRLRTAGRVIPEMQVRLFDDGQDVTATGGPGIAACRGAVNCLGYYADEQANRELYTPDGWMLTGDFCTIDADGYLTVAGRASDFIIRGGKNISAAQVEDEVATHPSISIAAAVAMPDPVFGERVCVYVEQLPGTPSVGLDELRAHLDARGVGKELWPERLEVLPALPRSSGGKVAKGALRDDVRAKLAAS
jgi:acyl-CoA synthetase